MTFDNGALRNRYSAVEHEDEAKGSIRPSDAADLLPRRRGKTMVELLNAPADGTRSTDRTGYDRMLGHKGIFSSAAGWRHSGKTAPVAPENPEQFGV